MVEKSCLGLILKENSDYFSIENEPNENYNKKLALFLMYERSQANKSFYYPFLNYYSKRKSISQWVVDEIDMLTSNDLKKQVLFH